MQVTNAMIVQAAEIISRDTGLGRPECLAVANKALQIVLKTQPAADFTFALAPGVTAHVAFYGDALQPEHVTELSKHLGLIEEAFSIT